MKKKWKIIIGVIVVIGIIGALTDGGEKKTEEVASVEESTSEEAPVEEPAEEEEEVRDYGKYYYDDDDAKLIYITATKILADNYINVKWPWGYDSYTFANMHEEDDGIVMGTTKVTADGIVDKLDVVICFCPVVLL